MIALVDQLNRCIAELEDGRDQLDGQLSHVRVMLEGFAAMGMEVDGYLTRLDAVDAAWKVEREYVADRYTVGDATRLKAHQQRHQAIASEFLDIAASVTRAMEIAGFNTEDYRNDQG